jgi:hypothetical protein
MSKVPGPAIALALLAMIGGRASAMVIVPADFAEMVAGSQTVVRGRVVDVRSQMVGDRRTIESVVTIAVQESIKGDAVATVFVRVPGGEVGRYRRFMIGAPAFTPGEEVVLFLTGRAPAIPVPFGLSQGVYRISHDAAGRTMVAPPIVAEGRVVRGDPARRPIEVSTFVQQVRTAMERQP